MIDLYKRLNVPVDASDEAIRAAVDRAAEQIAAAARHILLDPRRRTVYDRNRQVLVTIAQMRARLGLNYTRFWSPGRFPDFTEALEPPIGDLPNPHPEAADPLLVLRAFDFSHPRGHHRRRRRQRRVRALLIAVFFATLLLLIAYWRFRSAK